MGLYLCYHWWYDDYTSPSPVCCYSILPAATVSLVQGQGQSLFSAFQTEIQCCMENTMEWFLSVEETNVYKEKMSLLCFPKGTMQQKCMFGGTK